MSSPESLNILFFRFFTTFFLIPGQIAEQVEHGFGILFTPVKKWWSLKIITRVPTTRGDNFQSSQRWKATSKRLSVKIEINVISSSTF